MSSNTSSDESVKEFVRRVREMTTPSESTTSHRGLDSTPEAYARVIVENLAPNPNADVEDDIEDVLLFTEPDFKKGQPLDEWAAVALYKDGYRLRDLTVIEEALRLVHSTMRTYSKAVDTMRHDLHDLGNKIDSRTFPVEDEVESWAIPVTEAHEDALNARLSAKEIGATDEEIAWASQKKFLPTLPPLSTMNADA